MRVTPLDIRRQKFRKSMRGYDQGEVDAFLEMLADAWEEASENTLIEAKELEVLMLPVRKLIEKLILLFEMLS